MKKITIKMACLAILTFGISQAQVTFGARAGASLSKITDVSGGELKPDFYLGGLLNIKFTRLYQLQPEITYSSHGIKNFNGRERSNNNNDPYFRDVKKDIDVDYIGTSIINKFFPIHNIGFNLFLGPGLNIEVSGDDNADTLDIDLTAQWGLGYEFDNGLGFEARYIRGLIEAIDPKDQQNDYFFDFHHNYSFHIGFYYRFK